MLISTIDSIKRQILVILTNLCRKYPFYVGKLSLFVQFLTVAYNRIL